MYITCTHTTKCVLSGVLSIQMYKLSSEFCVKTLLMSSFFQGGCSWQQEVQMMSSEYISWEAGVQRKYQSFMSTR